MHLGDIACGRVIKPELDQVGVSEFIRSEELLKLHLQATCSSFRSSEPGPDPFHRVGGHSLLCTAGGRSDEGLGEARAIIDPREAATGGARKEGNGRLELHRLPLLEGHRLRDGLEGLGMTAGLENLELARHAPRLPLALMLAPASLDKQLGGRLRIGAASGAPKQRVADNNCVFPACVALAPCHIGCSGCPSVGGVSSACLRC